MTPQGLAICSAKIFLKRNRQTLNYSIFRKDRQVNAPVFKEALKLWSDEGHCLVEVALQLWLVIVHH